MKDQLISFETAKLAKEKGFNWKCGNYYSSKGNRIHDVVRKDYNGVLFAETKYFTNINYYSAPTQSLLQKWLREEHELYITVLPYRDYEAKVEFCFYYSLVQNSEEIDDILCNEDRLGASIDNFLTYEEALEAGLKQGLELI